MYFFQLLIKLILESKSVFGMLDIISLDCKASFLKITQSHFQFWAINELIMLITQISQHVTFSNHVEFPPPGR